MKNQKDVVYTDLVLGPGEDEELLQLMRPYLPVSGSEATVYGLPRDQVLRGILASLQNAGKLLTRSMGGRQELGRASAVVRGAGQSNVAYVYPNEPAYPIPALAPGCAYCRRSDVVIMLPMEEAMENASSPDHPKSGICFGCCRLGVEILGPRVIPAKTE